MAVVEIMGAKFRCTFTPAIVGGEGQVVTAITTSQVPLHPVSISANWIHSWLGDCVYELGFNRLQHV